MLWRAEYNDDGMPERRELSFLSSSVFEASYVGVVLFVMFCCLVVGLLTPEIIVFLALLFVWIPGIITSELALQGFSNEGMLTVGALFVVIESTRRSHIVPRLARKVFGVQTGFHSGLFRMCLTCYCLSAFLNNTPIVAILIPVTRDWARTRGFAPSQFLIPLSFSCILGGTATMIGTSTNLVVQGMIDEKYQFSFFDPVKVSGPISVLAIAYLVFLAPFSLPKQCGLFRYIRDRTEDLITEVHIKKGFKYIGMPVTVMLMSLGLDASSVVKIRRKALPQEGVKPNAGKDEKRAQAYWERRVEGSLYHRNTYRNANAHLWGRNMRPVKHTFSFEHSGQIAGSNNTPFAQQRQRSYSESLQGSPGSIFLPCEDDSQSGCISKLNSQHSSTTTTPNAAEANSNDCGLQEEFGESYVDVFPVPDDERLQVGDFLFLSIGLSKLLDFQNQASSVLMLEGLRFIACDALDIPGRGTDFFEVVISPQNHFVGMGGHRVPNFERYYECSVLALRKRGMAEAQPVYREQKDIHVSTSPHSTVHGEHPNPKPKDNECGGLHDVENNVQHPNYISNVLNTENAEEYRNMQHVHSAVEAMERPWEVGDVVLLFAKQDFDETWKNSSEFLLISRIGNVPQRVTLWDFVPVFLFLMLLLIVSCRWMTMVKAAFFISGLLLIFKFVPAKEALQAVNWELLLLIGSSLGLAKAIESSGLGKYIGNLIFTFDIAPRWILAIVFLITMFLTEMITNNAAAALCIPIVMEGAAEIGVNPQPFYLAVMLAASASFMTPIGYQTNTMVWAPGGYRFYDFARVGAPISLLFLIVSCILIPMVFPFHKSETATA